MILSLEGETSTTKSTTMYSAPWPLVAFAWDSGAVRALYGAKHEWFDDLDIDVRQYPHDINDLQWHRNHWLRNHGKAITVYLLPQPMATGSRLSGNRVLWNTFVMLSNLAATEPEVRSVGVDTMTIARRVAADSHLETMQANPKTADRISLLEVEWGKPGDMIRTTYTTFQNQAESFAARSIPKHFILTHHLREVRVDVPDGQGGTKSIIRTDSQHNPLLELEGLHNTLRFVDVAIRMERVLVDNPMDARAPKIPVIEGKFEKCGYDLSLKGEKITWGMGNTTPPWDSIVDRINKNLSPKIKIPHRGEE